jgi:hypothetical protein
MAITDALPNIDALVLSPIGIAIEHGFEVCIVALVAGSLVVDSVGEKSVEAKTD